MSCSTPKQKNTGPGQPVPKPYPYKKTEAPTWPTEVGAPLNPAIPPHSCMGLNSCKGQDRFGKNGPIDGPTAGKPNDCAGQGYCSTTANHQCHVQNQCKNQGGCGLYGTAEEMSHPGINDCKSLGSCATPINAERFITNGKYQGTSVWARARAAFEENWPEMREQLSEQGVKDLPQKLGPAPAPFTKIGPPYLWISDDNSERGNMTACGASGLSGAGGCG